MHVCVCWHSVNWIWVGVCVMVRFFVCVFIVRIWFFVVVLFGFIQKSSVYWVGFCCRFMFSLSFLFRFRVVWWVGCCWYSMWEFFGSFVIAVIVFWFRCFWYIVISSSIPVYCWAMFIWVIGVFWNVVFVVCVICLAFLYIVSCCASLL